MPVITLAAAPDVVYVRPGDIVVVGGAAAAPPEQRKTLTSQDGPVQLRPQSASADLTLVRTIGHVPRGLAYALFAPFPWDLRRPLDAAPIPEMLLWYAALAAAAASTIRDRTRWGLRAGCAGFVIGMLLLLSLVEGNYGTLYRHRVMVVPWVFLLSSSLLASITACFRAERPLIEVARVEPSTAER